MSKYVSAVRISIHHGIRSRKRVGGGRLEGSYVPPKELRVLPGLTRYRVKLVEHQSAVACRYRNYLNDATSSCLPSPVTFWASGTGYAAWPVQTDGVQKAERRLHQPTLVEAPSRTCDKALLATIKKVGPSQIPVFYSMTRQSRVPARRASAAAHGTVSSLRLLRRGRGPLQFR